jgi:hypothetical protein
LAKLQRGGAQTVRVEHGVDIPDNSLSASVDMNNAAKGDPVADGPACYRDFVRLKNRPSKPNECRHRATPRIQLRND